MPISLYGKGWEAMAKSGGLARVILGRIRFAPHQPIKWEELIIIGETMESARTTALAAEGLVTRAQLATELDITEQSILLWEKDGLPVLKVGKQRLYDIKKVAGWIRRVGK